MSETRASIRESATSRRELRIGRPVEAPRLCVVGCVHRVAEPRREEIASQGAMVYRFITKADAIAIDRVRENDDTHVHCDQDEADRRVNAPPASCCVDRCHCEIRALGTRVASRADPCALRTRSSVQPAKNSS